MGSEGANVLFDTWVHPLMMGLEEHLLHMFRDDFEFADGAAPSHLAARRRRRCGRDAAARTPRGAGDEPSAADAPTRARRRRPRGGRRAEQELGKIPFFVRGKARRNTERFAVERGLAEITSTRCTTRRRTMAR